MKDKLLIAHSWKTLGWVLAVPAFVGGIIFMVLDCPESLTVAIPDWLARFMWVERFMQNGPTSRISLMDELISLSLLAGLLLLAFSKEKIEDEWIQKVRLESFQWAFLVNSLLLAAFTIFTHGLPFLSVMVYNMFTPLLIFVGRYYYVLHLKPLFSKN